MAKAIIYPLQRKWVVVNTTASISPDRNCFTVTAANSLPRYQRQFRCTGNRLEKTPQNTQCVLWFSECFGYLLIAQTPLKYSVAISLVHRGKNDVKPWVTVNWSLVLLETGKICGISDGNVINISALRRFFVCRWLYYKASLCSLFTWVVDM